MTVDKARKYITNVTPGFLRKSWVFYLAASSVVCLFFWQYLATGNNKTLGGDFDYYSQLYEAFRISVLKFHQLPFWNPWLSGGMPLFANPQFGLFSIQSLLVLPFGAIYGLKLAYVVYALAGFWGMYAVGRRVSGASKTRSALIGYIWVFGGFFAGHNISHFTFTLFYLMPWLLYFIALRRNRRSWLWLGIIESVIILSSIHYAFLMAGLAMAAYFIVCLIKVVPGKGLGVVWKPTKADALFISKTAIVVLVLAGYRFLITYLFVSHNQRPASVVQEARPSLAVIFQGLFLPIDTLLKVPKGLQWGWGEYSMYTGLGTGLALVVILYRLGRKLLFKQGGSLVRNRVVVIGILCVGLIGFLLAIGDVGSLSPYHVLRLLPGFDQIRVSSRWLIMTVFSLLVFLLAWRPDKKLINALLLLSVAELFLSYGLLRVSGSNEFYVPAAGFNSSFSQYDNNRKHLDASKNIMHSYYFTTSKNIGQVYSDDSIVETLDGVLLTRRCGYNDQPSCPFILTNNARIVYWSPDKIVLSRTAIGPIELNMNVDAGWQVNGTYPYAQYKPINPAQAFILPGGENYTLRYAPKLSPSWAIWRVEKFSTGGQ